MSGYPFLSPSPTDRVDEYWCDNTNRTLPRDLIRSEVFEPGDIGPYGKFIAFLFI